MKEIDENVLELAIAGDAMAFRKIVERYQRDVLETVLGILGRDQAVDDVVQETFIKLYKSLERFERRSSLKTYVTRIAVNKSLDQIRKRKRKEARETSLDVGHESQRLRVDFDKVSDDEELVWLALDNLKESYREIVVLRMLKGYSTKETAEILGLKYGTVLSRLSRAMEKMRTTLLPLYKG